MAPYAIGESQNNNAECIDATQTTDWALCYAKDTRQKKKNNMKLYQCNGRSYRVYGETTKYINPYGPNYW